MLSGPKILEEYGKVIRGKHKVKNILKVFKNAFAFSDFCCIKLLYQKQRSIVWLENQNYYFCIELLKMQSVVLYAVFFHDKIAVFLVELPEHEFNMIAVDTTTFGHSEVVNNRLSLSTSIFTAVLLDSFVELGVSKNFCLIVNCLHEAFFRKRFPEYELVVLKFPPLFVVNKITKGKHSWARLLKKFGIFSRAVNRRKEIKAIWFPCVNPEIFVKTTKPAILTIHDLFFLHSEKEKSLFAKILADEKNKVVSISNYTKNKIENDFSYKRKISVIPNGVAVDVSKTEPVKRLEDSNFILDINSYEKKKNAITLLKAFNLIKEKTDCNLVFCGGYKHDDCFGELEDFTKENGLTGRVSFFLAISEEQKNWLLTHARIFVTPSLLEGFGRTPVEAAICGIPVISTKETALPEATLGLVNYYENATDEKELAALILKKLEEPDSKERLSLIAEKLKQEYAPTNVANKYLDVFREFF